MLEVRLPESHQSQVLKSSGPVMSGRSREELENAIVDEPKENIWSALLVLLGEFQSGDRNQRVTAAGLCLLHF